MLRPRGDARQRLHDFFDFCSWFGSARRRAAAQLLDPIAVEAVVVLRLDEAQLRLGPGEIALADQRVGDEVVSLQETRAELVDLFQSAPGLAVCGAPEL